jgi:steroid delta-isomerase-like uncharacterized protein
MSTEENKAIVRRYREAYNANNLDALDQIVAKDLVSHSLLPGLPPGLEGGKMAHRIFLQSFPDSQTKSEMMIAEGDKVFELYTSHGTHKGEFMGFPATGKKYEISSMVVYRFANGKIVEQWGLNDAQTLMMQLGMMPMPGQAGK